MMGEYELIGLRLAPHWQISGQPVEDLWSCSDTLVVNQWPVSGTQWSISSNKHIMVDEFMLNRWVYHCFLSVAPQAQCATVIVFFIFRRRRQLVVRGLGLPGLAGARSWLVGRPRRWRLVGRRLACSVGARPKMLCRATGAKPQSLDLIYNCWCPLLAANRPLIVL